MPGPRTSLWQCKDAGLMLEDYGWKVVGNQVLPLTTDLPAAPQAFLKMIRCNCTTDCATRSCSCRKHGLECSPACGQCHGTACTNSSIIDDSDDDKDYPHALTLLKLFLFRKHLKLLFSLIIKRAHFFNQNILISQPGTSWDLNFRLPHIKNIQKANYTLKNFQK